MHRVGEYMYGSGDDTLEAVVGEQLRAAGKSLALAESCTGGLIAARLTDVPGSSEYFPGGVVAYSNEAKQRLLDVPQEVLQEHGAVSEATAAAMAKGVAARFGATIGLAVTGIAGPGGGSDEKPVGLVFIATFENGRSRVRRLLFGGERGLVRLRAAQTALDMVRRQLRTEPPTPTTADRQTVADAGPATDPTTEAWIAAARPDDGTASSSVNERVKFMQNG